MGTIWGTGRSCIPDQPFLKRNVSTYGYIMKMYLVLCFIIFYIFSTCSIIAVFTKYYFRSLLKHSESFESFRRSIAQLSSFCTHGYRRKNLSAGPATGGEAYEGASASLGGRHHSRANAKSLGNLGFRRE